MPKPRVIPPDREPEILARAGKGETAEQIAAWLSLPEVLNRPVDGRRVREFLEANRKSRAGITAAIIEKRVSESVVSDLDAVAALLNGERTLQEKIGRLDKLIDQLEEAAQSDLADFVDDKGRVLDLKKMPVAKRRAIASIKVQQDFSEKAGERYHSGDVIELKPWDKIAAIVAIGRIRAQAVEMQKKLLELRLKLNGAGEKKGKTAHDFVLIAQRRRKAAAEAAGGGGAPPAPPVPPAT